MFLFFLRKENSEYKRRGFDWIDNCIESDTIPELYAIRKENTGEGDPIGWITLYGIRRYLSYTRVSFFLRKENTEEGNSIGWIILYGIRRYDT